MIPLGIYEHYKGGRYEVIALAKREGSLEDMVVYKPLYDNPVANCFVRPLAEFTQEVICESVRKPRFRFVTQDGTHP